MLQLALPVIITYLGQMTMGLVDLVCVGRVSAAAVGAVGVGTSIFSWIMIFGIGMLTGLDYLISHAHGAGNTKECHLSWSQGFWLSAWLGIPLTALLYWFSHHLNWLGINPEVIAPSQGYLAILSFSLIPVYLFTASRGYLLAMGSARPAAIILIVANLVNAVANWALVLGHLGFPAMGAEGAAIATVIARLFMVLTMMAYQVYFDRKHHGFFAAHGIPFESQQTQKLLKLGTPTALHMTFEVGVFALSTTLAARLAAEALAAHQIVLNIASMTFMVPLGISSAAAVLVGREMGKGSRQTAAHEGWKGLGLGVGFMVLSCICLLLFSTPIIELYTNDAAVRALAKRILFIAGIFQISDGAQIVATGALRGVADTRTPMYANLFGHWCVGLPIGIFLCFYRSQGLLGLWTGLALGLTTVAIILVLRWRQRSRHA